MKILPKLKINIMKLVSPTSIVAAVWMCLSASSKYLFKISIPDLLDVLFTVIVIHITYLIFNYFLTVFFKASKEDRTAFIFVASQKTMPLAILILYSISKNLAQAVIACLFYHFMQVLIDSIIAAFIVKRKKLVGSMI